MRLKMRDGAGSSRNSVVQQLTVKINVPCCRNSLFDISIQSWISTKKIIQSAIRSSCNQSNIYRVRKIYVNSLSADKSERENCPNLMKLITFAARQLISVQGEKKFATLRCSSSDLSCESKNQFRFEHIQLLNLFSSLAAREICQLSLDTIRVYFWM